MDLLRARALSEFSRLWSARLLHPRVRTYLMVKRKHKLENTNHEFAPARGLNSTYRHDHAPRWRLREASAGLKGRSAAE